VEATAGGSGRLAGSSDSGKGLMRKIVTIVLHNLKILASDKSALFWLLAMPIAFTFVTGMAFREGGGGDQGGPVRYALTVANLDAGDRGEALLQAIVAADEIDLLRVEGADAGVEAKRLVEDGERSAALVIPADFSEKAERDESAALVFHRNPERMNPFVTQGAVEQVISRMNADAMAAEGAQAAYEKIRGRPSPEKSGELAARVHAFVEDHWEPPAVGVTVEKLGRPSEREVPTMGFSHSSPAVALMFVLLNGLMMSSMLVQERRERTLMRLFTAPVRRSEIIAANLGWRFLVGTVQMGFLILVGRLLFRVDWGASPTGLVLVSVTYVSAVAGLSVLIGSIARTSRQAESASLILALTMSGLGGLWWPLEVTPRGYQAAAHAVPTAWAMDAMHNLVSRGYSLAGVAPQALVLLLFALGFAVAATLAFRYE